METDLYLPVKRFLESLGFEVKGEIGGCDVVGRMQGEAGEVVVVCELKMSFNLELLLQAVDRAQAADEVWIAARVSAKGKGREADRRFRDLCRRLGLGMIGVDDRGEAQVLVKSVSPMPRTNPKRRSRLMREFDRRRGDPIAGGSTRTPQMTAYRQQALAVAAALRAGRIRPAEIRPDCPDAGKILQSNVYGWFLRVERGVYALTAAGEEALARWGESEADARA
jgi:hypothetical protein